MLLVLKTEEGAGSPERGTRGASGTRRPRGWNARPRKKYGLSSEPPEGTSPLTARF